MGSFGEKLRREREKRGIRLEEIAEATKIGTRSLKALEDEHFSQLPGGIFNKGFVRAYARFLGIDEEQAVADYVATAGDQLPSPDLIAQQRVMAKASQLAAEQASQRRSDLPITRLVIVLAVIGLLIYGAVHLIVAGWPKSHTNAASASKAPEVATSPAPAVESTPQTDIVPPRQLVAPPAPSPVAQETSPVSSNSSPRVATALPVDGPPSLPEFVYSNRSSEECWVSVEADGKTALLGMLEPNEKRTFTARRIKLIVGHPSTAELSLNGRPLALSGDLNRSRRFVVDAGGLQNE